MMIRRMALLATAVAAVTAASAQDLTVKLWDNASAPHSNGIAAAEKDEGGGRVSHTTEAVLYIYKAAGEMNSRQAVVICPGGGYYLAAMGHEGHDMARWLAANGVTAAVLKYRMPDGHPEVPMEDAAEAVRYMREEYPSRDEVGQVGIMGFSAGGHFAAATGVGALDKYAGRTGGGRPDFMILFYPVITADPLKGHQGSFDNLLGRDRTAETTAPWSLENLVDRSTPPALLLLSDDDTGVPPANSVRFYDALKREGIRASIRIFPSGGHGWGFRDSFRYKEQWQRAVLDWLGCMQPKN